MMLRKDKEGMDMVKGKLIPLVVTAFFIIVISVFSFSLMGPKLSEPASSKVSADETEMSGNGESGDSTITNNVENNINGENAEVKNSIDNNVKNGEKNTVDNNVSNNIEVNVDVQVTNEIGNNVEGQTSNSGHEDKGTSNNSNGDDASASSNTSNDEIVWGVDSASHTTSEMLSCVRENFGDPLIWGRYLGEKDGVSEGLTADEIELLHSNDIEILLIWNHFEDARGYENGRSEAEQAIAKAEEFAVPEGVALFADIEPNYPVDSEFIRGWSEVMFDSKYESGIYGIFDAESDLTKAFNEAAQSNSHINEQTYIWTAAPNIGITSQSNVPKYEPEAPENSKVGGWQYGIDAESCNIDTNLFSKNMREVLW